MMDCLNCDRELPYTDASPVCINTKECDERRDRAYLDVKPWPRCEDCGLAYAADGQSTCMECHVKRVRSKWKVDEQDPEEMRDLGITDALDPITGLPIIGHTPIEADRRKETRE